MQNSRMVTIQNICLLFCFIEITYHLLQLTCESFW
jgi:hypothetical protein